MKRQRKTDMSTKNDGRWTSNSTTFYSLARLVKDAKHFKENGDKEAATYVTFVHGTKNGKDIFIDARIVRGAALYEALKKGDMVNVTGRVEFSEDEKSGQIRGKIWYADVQTPVNLQARAGMATDENVEAAVAAAPFAAGTESALGNGEGMGPAFD